MTAAGGAWNASIVAELMSFKDMTAEDGRAGRDDHGRLRQPGIFRCGRKPDRHGRRGGAAQPDVLGALYRSAQTRFRMDLA